MVTISLPSILGTKSYHPDFFSLSAALLAWVSAFFCLADLPAFSCCLVSFGGLPAAAASAFFWLLDLGGIFSWLASVVCQRRQPRPSSGCWTWVAFCLDLSLVE